LRRRSVDENDDDQNYKGGSLTMKTMMKVIKDDFFTMETRMMKIIKRSVVGSPNLLLDASSLLIDWVLLADWVPA